MDKKIAIIAVVAIVAITAVAVVVVLNPFGNGGSGGGDVTGDEVSWNGKPVEKTSNGLWVNKETGKIAGMKCEPYTFTDGIGKQYTFDHTFDAIAIADTVKGGPMMTMLALCGSDIDKYIVAWDKDKLTSDSMQDFAWLTKDMPKLASLPLLDANSPMTVVATNPGAYVHMMTAPESDLVAQKLKETLNVDTFYMYFQGEDPTTISNTIKMLGMMFGLTERANELAKLYVDKVTPLYQNAEKLIKANGGVRPQIYCECQGWQLDKFANSYNNETMWGAFIYNLGGQGVKTNWDADGMTALDSGGAFPVYNAAALLAHNAAIDAIAITCQPEGSGNIHTGYDETKEKIIAKLQEGFSQTEGPRNGLGNLNAWKDGDVMVVAHQLNRNLYDFVGVEAMAKLIWPEEYKNLDPQKDFFDFWHKYMPKELSIKGVWVLYYGDEVKS
ncbi:iron ABC transporter substrate-binding protein [methanogenic archaeon mixed culture ISO4-G1]|nr:iron ABC transporter substrate-binding protein [methanogenic archaeon mixed culture ISO4-G1]